MFLSPSDLRHVTLASGMRGYDRAAVDGLLENVITSYEGVWRERDELKARLAELADELDRSRELERLLRDTLVVAQRSADELKAQSRLEAEATVEEARASARQIVHDAEVRAGGLRTEIERLESAERGARARLTGFLREALAYLETGEGQIPGEPRPSLVDDLRPGLEPAARDDEARSFESLAWLPDVGLDEDAL